MFFSTSSMTYKVYLGLLLFCIVSVVFADVGVNDDLLNAQVSFSCPLPTTDDYASAAAAANSTGNSTAVDGGDDYYGDTLPATYPAFVFFYSWMCVITIFPLLFFAYNNKIAPVGQVKPFLPEGKRFFFFIFFCFDFLFLFFRILSFNLLFIPQLLIKVILVKQLTIVDVINLVFNNRLLE
jgi:hypothetical protein